MVDKIKTYAHVYPLQKDAIYSMDMFIKAQYEKISKVVGREYVVLKNGDIHFFMSDHTYPKWCRGREYILNGVYYRSGYIFAKGEL